MQFRSTSDAKRGGTRLLITLVALCLPVFAATFLSGSFFHAGTLQPGQVLDAAVAQAASQPMNAMHMMHAAPATSETPGPTVTEDRTQTPGTTTTPQASTTPGGGNIVDVQMQSHDLFVPAYVTISVGDTVRWTNVDEEQHTTTADNGAWNSGPLNPGQQFTFTFLTPGTYTYACMIHSEMRGTIVVTGQAPTPTPGGFTPTPQTTSTPVGGTVDVRIENYAFNAQNITVLVGTTVRWTNMDSAPHTTTSDNGVWNSGTLNQGQQFSYTFNTPGTYAYHCDIHTGMRGSVTVVTNTGGTPTVTAQPSQTAGSTNTPASTFTPGSTNTPGATNTPAASPTYQATATARASATTTRTVQPTNTPAPRTVDVSILNYAYSPRTVTIQVGDTIRWTNMDNDRHSVTSAANPPAFDSGEFTQNQTWSYTFNTPGSYDYFCTVHGTFMSATIIVEAPPATATATPTFVTGQIFSDVTPNDYFYTAVNWLVGQGVISGYSDGTFRPYNNATRGQLTKMVVLGEGWTIVTPPTPTFTDVQPGDTFYGYVETAVSHNVISGYTDHTFRPGNNVTRGQLAKIIVLARGWTLANPPTATFTDVPAGSAFFQYVETAVQHQVISGYSDNTFRPGANATRGQISKILYNALNGAR